MIASATSGPITAPAIRARFGLGECVEFATSDVEEVTHATVIVEGKDASSVADD